jgi:riboflavin kinase / FMN adenylyltransferase
MDVYQGFPTPPLQSPVYLTIGNFDGVHRGHQMLICELAEAAHAAGGLAGLLTFEPHPVAVLRPEVTTLRLTMHEERADLLAALGLDFVVIHPFTRETAATPAAGFLAQLVRHMPLAELWVGPDFALGKGREGNTERLAELGRDMGFALRVVPPFEWRGEQVRSSRVRSLLSDHGAVEQAADLLGRPYRVEGQVVLGAQRGRSLGFPTANLLLPQERLVPAYGVYACWAWRGATGYPAVVNIGVRPSFDNGHPSVEAYLLNFSGSLYDEILGLSFVARLRGEKKFASIGELVAQITADAERARQILADPRTHAQAVEADAWRELAHTADWAVDVTGANPRQLFANAAAAMYALQDADPSAPITGARAIGTDADRREDLLVAWLNRLLLGQELGGEMYTRFEIFELSERGIRGVAYGYRGTPAHTAIKAVTYYDLSVRRTEGGWEARVTFDV